LPSKSVAAELGIHEHTVGNPIPLLGRADEVIE
jgi:hypothetical protein